MTAQELKNSILMQAVQGKLVPQDPNDEPASVLLAKIRAEKEQMMKEGKIKKEPISEIYVNPSDNQHYEKVGKTVKCIEDEIPFQIPKGWEWCRLNTLGEYRKGPFGSTLTKSMFIPKCESSIKVYEQKNAIKKDATLGDYYISKDYYEKNMKNFSVKSGDVIVSCAGTIGETYVLPNNIENGIINQALMRMRITPLLDIQYFLIYFDYSIKKYSIATSKGSAIKNIPPFSIFKQFLFPVPPIQEQKKIVNRMAEIEIRIKEYQHLYENINLINDSIKEKLKKSILQYAIEGKLVKQNPNDEPASELIKRIRAEKEKLIKSGKLKKDKNESFIYRGSDNSYYEKFQNGKEVCIDDEIPFEIPQSWEWIRFGNLVNFQLGKTPEREKVKYWQNGKYKWVSISDMVSNGYVLDTKEYVSEDAKIEKFSKLSPAGTLIMSFKLTVGKISILGCDAFHNEAIISIFPLKDSGTTTRDYLFKVLPHIVKYGDEKKSIKGVTLNSKSIAKLMIPLPPIAEQQRIVSAIKECFNLLK